MIKAPQARAAAPASAQRRAELAHARGAALARLIVGDPGSLPLLMGVVNVTPDSFSDGGRFLKLDAALEHAQELVTQGAQILDVGGYSTRPGADDVCPEEEAARVLPVIEALARELPQVVLSVDTFRAEVARQAVEAGAGIVNDVTGGNDPLMHATVARLRVERGPLAGGHPVYVCQHMRGTPQTMDSLASYGDVVAQVGQELSAQAAKFVAAGGQEERLVLDPGIGFSKDAEQSWRLLAQLGRLLELGYPLLVGTSRKRLLGAALGAADQGAAGRDVATAVTTALAGAAGAWAVRVHNVAFSADARAVAAAWGAAGGNVGHQIR
ncbi:MAG: dihydropteroate synthase [Buchananella hordeovulneris]|nr:dihydropteroate synthase [Buchananella hordeovulneris]